LRGVFGKLDHVLHHGQLGSGDRRGRVVLAQRCNQLVIQRDPTQKLCVRVDSVAAAVGERGHGGDHLLVSPAQRQGRRHQDAKGRESVVKGFGDQAVRDDDLGRLFVGSGILGRIEFLLGLEGLDEGFVRFFDPRHGRSSRQTPYHVQTASLKRIVERPSRGSLIRPQHKAPPMVRLRVLVAQERACLRRCRRSRRGAAWQRISSEPIQRITGEERDQDGQRQETFFHP
jgi:hypothetical protein